MVILGALIILMIKSQKQAIYTMFMQQREFAEFAEFDLEHWYKLRRFREL